MDLKPTHSDIMLHHSSLHFSNESKKTNQLTLKTLGLSEQNKDLINNLMRKYSYDPKLYIKNFVPVLRPMENDKKIIPSKLVLNCKKRNSSTLSNPSSKDENEINNENEELNLSNSFVNSVISNSPTDSDNNDNEINNVRKNFTRIRKYSLQRNLSKKNIQNKKTGKISLDMGEKIYSDINNDRKESKDSYEKIKFNLMPKKSGVILSSLKMKENNRFNNQQIKQRNRINSCSILETLQNKLKLDK